MTFLRARSYTQSAEELTAQIDPVKFEDAFGSPPEQLNSLLEAKAVTIGRLMEIAPMGTIDPSPNLYDTTLYSMGGKFRFWLTFYAVAALTCRLSFD